MKGISRFASISSILVGVLYLLTVIMILLSTPGENSVIDHVNYELNLTLAHYFLGFIGIFGVAVVMKSSFQLRSKNEFLDYTKVLALIGFGLLSVNNLRQVGLDHRLAHEAMHHSGEYYEYTVFFWRGLVELSPQGWVDFGFVGIWLITFNILVVKERAFYKLLALLGITLGLCFIITVLGNATPFKILTQIGMGLGGMILAPIYFIWIGLILFKDELV